MKKFNLKLSIVIMSIFLLHNVNAQRRMSVRTANPVTHWESGPLDANKLTPRTGNSKVWNNVKFKPGEYEVAFEVVDLRPNRPDTDKIGLSVTGLYQDANIIRNDEKVKMYNGYRPVRFFIRQYNSKTNRSPLNYGKVKITASKGIRTNAKFKITIHRVSSNTFGYDLVKIRNKRNQKWTYLKGHASSLGNNFIRTDKRIPSNGAKIWIKRLGGKAKTMFKIYTSNTSNGAKTFLTSYEYPHNTSETVHEIELNNLRNKYIHIEIDNESAALDFHWSLGIYKRYEH